MTQPPDDRPRPDQPGGDGGSENEPTVAWTPPEPDPEKPAAEAGPGSAAEPPTPEAPSPGGDVPPAAAAGPIISATPTPPASGWEQPSQTAVPPPVAPTGGWEVPAAAAAAPQQDGYVIAGVGARFVAWLIDITIAGIVPAALSLALIDWSRIITDALEQAQRDPTGGFNAPTAYSIPVTLDLVLVTLIGLGIQYLYFVGFWTSRWRATPGMIGLKMRLVDATSGDGLSVVQATKRWIALGWPLSLLTLVPALQASQGLIQFALWVFLFFTTVTNDRRQGLHDKWANSLVIRSVTSGNGATFAGCLVWGVLIILLGFIATTIFFAAAMPQIQDYIESLPSNPV